VSSIVPASGNFEVSELILAPAGSRNFTATKVGMKSFGFCSSSYDYLSFLLNIVKAHGHALPNKITKALWMNVLLYCSYKNHNFSVILISIY
jgi:hypothetical protein